MSDIPLYTGWLTVQLSGDVDKAKDYERDGRHLLGTLLANHGVVERLANGEPGGFFKKFIDLPNGTRMTAITNNGHHLVRIHVPPEPEHAEAPHHQTDGDVRGEHVTVYPSVETSFQQNTVPHPPLPSHEVEEEGEEEKKDSSDYMWIGIRSTTPDVPWYSMQAMLIEPDTGPTWDGEHPKRGIVTSIDYWSGKWLWAKYDGDEMHIEQPEDSHQAYVGTIDESIQDNYDTWTQAVDPGPMANMIPGTHNIEVNIGEDLNDGMVLVSANGVRCYSTYNTVQTQSDITKWMPFDPLADDQSGAGVRNYGDRKLLESYPIPSCLWDISYVLDPDEDAQQYPCDTRPHALALRRALEKVGMTNQALPGQYMLALHVYDDYPQLRSTRAGEEIPLFADLFRDAQGDYVEFLQPYDATLNTGVYVEVRLGRGETAAVYKFETVITGCDDRLAENLPYGFETYDECGAYGGPNPFGPNFAQQLVAIDVLGGSAQWVDLGEADLGPILGGNSYGYPDDPRGPLDIYIFYTPLSQPGQDNYAEWAAYAVYSVLEYCTGGGRYVMADPGGETGLMGVFADASQSVIWKYDAASKTITPVPMIGNIDDYPYGTQVDAEGHEFESPYKREMAWYYPYKYMSWNACRSSFGVMVTAIKTSFYLEADGVYFADPPPPDDCC